ncbi:putative SNF2 family N-terminal domain containing protein [Klebsormidium nitens]|uniref:Putative SNF2 family N-terminal domain containing protein n=1 Tax=Klebsormidium nitens TaxID=105231 RepID=A0A0U9HM76_KLENI|nr:putative SNF2 family N-terminal domain containing protein [Klebsormidium nitens]|eukprot:GAQ79429.1 putative SNF2 family N-terminal domain containing protein [Klebsormidium nitens]
MQPSEKANPGGEGVQGKEADIAVASPDTVLADATSEETDSEEYVDQKLLEEERQLEAEREKEDQEAAEKEAASRPAVPRPADGMDQLTQLLLKTNAYTDFLYKQLTEKEKEKENEETGDGDEEPKTPGSKKGTKRKGGSRKGAKAKKQKQEEEAAAALETHLAKTEEEGRKSPEKEGRDKDDYVLAQQKKLMPDFQGEMRDYQVKGVKWLISLWNNGLNGILADQMGLGKTVQTIGFLSHLKSNGMNGPFLVMGPLSTVTNWMSEFARWAPHMPVILYHGSPPERAALRAERMPHKVGSNFPVVVTTYEIVMRDLPALKRWHWKYIVVDEGHRLKNKDCKLFSKLKELTSDNRLLLTGTPLQNNLAELWSLLNFILPKVFTSVEKFESWFDITGAGGRGKEQLDEEKRGEVISKLHQILKPFLLRRMKEDVEQSLPRKKEILLYAQMTSQQQRYQEQLLNRTLDEYLQKESGSGIPRTRLQNLLMQLRKNCNHPDLLVSHYDDSLLYPPVEELLAQCGKMQLLDRLLKHLREGGHKVLIFSQMTRMLDLLAYYLEERGYRNCRIDGSMASTDRQANIADFNRDPDLFAFLLSTRAGGLGINLTAADTVIIYDSDWNPHQDMQAMDRCHRIGQTRPVHVYRLATAHSVECKMLEKAGGKLKLEHMVITKGNFRIENLKDQPASVQENELRAMLEPEMDERDELVQSGEISDDDMLKLLDRGDLELETEGKEVVASKLPSHGRGFSVVMTNNTPSVLNTVQ